MAICYANNQVIHAEESVGVLRAVAYASRCEMRCPISGKTYDWSRYKSDLLFREVLLPGSARPDFRNPPRAKARHSLPDAPQEKTHRMSRTLWRAVDQSERVFDRKDKAWRFRKRGQLAYRLILALPAGRPVAEISRLARDFVQEQFVDKGVPAEIAIHKAEEEGGLNIHAHVIIATRELGPDGFGAKARHLLPDFVGHQGKEGGTGWSRIRAGHEWPRRWAAYQNSWYRHCGIDVEVDPIAAEPSVHLGKWRDPEVEAERRAAEDAKRAEAAAIARDPERLLKVIEDQMPVFSLRDIRRHLRRNGILGHEANRIAQSLLALPSIVAVEPRLSQLPKEPKPGAGGRRLYTSRGILQQEDQIHRRAEYLYGDVVWDRPLPARMAVRAEQLITERGLDPEQAAAVRHTIEGPGIRVIQGVAGAGKSYLLSTIRTVFERFDYEVVAMAPTNMVASDLRSNGFDACTIHRFISDVRKGKRKLAPNTVLVVDEAGMVNAALYDELLGIAVQHRCRLILSGDDRQLPPIGRGGVFGKIRHMIGDARLSKVRRQNADWMKSASESLSNWDIAAGIEAYQSRKAVKWNSTPEQSTHALVEQCGRDFDADPSRDLRAFFVYCALNRSADFLNRAIQERIWRNAPEGGAQELKCCRGKVQIRPGDRIQFHETDLKLGLFNGAIGTIAGLDGQGVHVRLDGGETVAFDPGEFEGWGLGYAGTVHRGQGQTKHRSYVLYDSAYLWNAALTYVALTRHKETTALFVPRSLAANAHALIEQMSQTVSQPLASDYVEINSKRAQEDARVELQPRATWTIVGADGRERELNLVRKDDLGEAEAAFRRLPTRDFADAYARLLALQRGRPGDHPYSALRRSAETTANVRGFLPSSGTADPNCLFGLFREDEREHHIEGALLAREPGKIDVSPMVIEPSQIEVGLWRVLVERLRRFDAFVREAIHDRLVELRSYAPPESAVNAGLATAQFLLRLCRVSKPGMSPSDGDIAAAVRVEAARRQTLGSLKIWRKTGPGDYEPVNQLEGIRQAFGAAVPPPMRANPVPQALQVPLASPEMPPTARTTAPSISSGPGRREGPQFG